MNRHVWVMIFGIVGPWGLAASAQEVSSDLPSRPASVPIADDKVDLVFIATAPAAYGPAQIREKFLPALSDVGIELAPDDFRVEPIHSIADFEALRRIAADPASLAKDSRLLPLVYPVEDPERTVTRWLVHVQDSSRPVAALRVTYRKPGEEEPLTEKWELDTGMGEGARFQVKSKVDGDYHFLPDPSWALESYQIFFEGKDGDVTPWPKNQRRYEIRLLGFPNDEAKYAGFKAAIQDPKKDENAPQILGEQIGLFSIAELGRADPDVLDLKPSWSDGAFTFSVRSQESDQVWLLFPLTEKQKNSVVTEFIKLSGTDLTEKTLHDQLNGGTSPLKGYPVDNQGGQRQWKEMGGTRVPQWYGMDRLTEPTWFQATFAVKNVTPRNNPFFDPKAGVLKAYAVVVACQGGKAKRFGPNKDLYRIVSVEEWNGGIQLPVGK